jgi:geranylgeranyl diphosphate synthase, type I
MKEFFEVRKAAIRAFLEEFLSGRSADLSEINDLGPLTLKRLLDYSRDGKMIRGGLAGLGQGLFAGELNRDADRLGAVMELFQSALLIHDDIMDRDRMRRGKPAMHVQYSDDLHAAQADSPDRTGESLGICAGDIAFFLGYEILSSMELGTAPLRRIFGLCSREMTGVGLGQMQDIRFGVLPSSPSREEILSLYVHKTGRYTFSLPLMAGAVAGGAAEKELTVLSELGEVLGVIFQIKDDELGLFGTAESIGKPVGTDLSEGKQTLFYSLLVDRLTEAEKVRLLDLKGVPSVPAAEIEFVRLRLRQTGVLDEVEAQLTLLQERAHLLLTSLPVTGSSFGTILRSFVDYNLSRRA